MKVYYDFHIHTALSPCGDDDMTPNNIVNLANLLNLDVIAITDHNTTGNCGSVMEVASKLGSPLVIPGMEVETSEEIHVILLFPTLVDGQNCEKEIKTRKLKIKNDVDIYGHQYYLDADDNIVGENDDLLVVSTSIGLNELISISKKYGAVCYPAHIDRQSHGIIQILGDIDKNLGFHCVEVSKNANQSFIDSYKARGYKVIFSSDAHYLDCLNTQGSNFLELETLDTRHVLESLENK